MTAPLEAASSTTLVPAVAPAPASEADTRLDALLTERFAAVMRRSPIFATYLGLDQHDGELSDGSREAILADIEEARAFVATLEAVDALTLTPYYATERELAVYATRRQIFDDDVHRVWERRVNAADEIGDGVFLVFSRGTRPFDERIASITARLEAAPRHIEEQKSRLGAGPPVLLWNDMELDSAKLLPSLFSEVVASAKRQLGDDHAEIERLERAATRASAALTDYSDWLRGQLARGTTDDFALGTERYEELVGLRAFDDLDAAEILAIGEEQLALNSDARRRLASEIDPGVGVEEVVDRVKSDHPPTFAGALDGYRGAMDEARQFVVDKAIASMPADESISVIETPEYLRNVMPFAAYFNPPKFGRGSVPKGLYVVTPSVDGDAGAMKEHNYASIYNTSIHEAYPGHHQQLAAANTHPSLIRLLVDAPEFTEGWAMYCEQMMREEGFDTQPSHLLMMYTDAIWRACRIILDVKLHRGEISVDDAIDFMVDQTGFERPNATAEVHRYTYTPTYQLSYLLGKVLLLRLRDDERRRLGGRFELRAFHDALLREGSLPISFHRRLLAAANPG